MKKHYPNPFNPSTNIKFQILNSGLVKLTVFDALGREVQSLIEAELARGTYEVQWDASNYHSGIYFYSISTGEYFETRKMILIK
jgi:hypothetical protein